MADFDRYVGVDYSGARTPTSGLPGLRVYVAEGDGPPRERQPPPSRRKHWTRVGVADFLEEVVSGAGVTVVGIDHGFAFPLAYLERHRLEHDWDQVLDDFCRHWPSEGADVTVEQLRRGELGQAAARGGETTWRRLAEERAGGAKSVFHFDVPGSVAKSTHAGLPWLRRLRRRRGSALHAWPFDGWTPPRGCSVVAEAYPSLWSADFARKRRTPDQHDAYVVAAWLQAADRDGRLRAAWEGPASTEDRARGRIEGWILGVR